MEGSVSQNVDCGFVLCYEEEGILKKKVQKITKITRFLSLNKN